jgi:predicted MFS family arabinose efflux permease
MAAALGGLALFVRHERAGGKRLLPSGACDLANPLGVSYAAMALLLIGVNTEIFVPYFLQILHAMRPIDAGYLSALMSAGWTTGSVISSGARPGLTRVVMLAGPLSIAAALAVLFLLMPQRYEHVAALSAIGCAMAAMGLGIGMAWPHVAASIFTWAPEGERELAAASITVVTMVTNAFGSAMGGMLTNLAGLTVPGGPEGAASAAHWLFGCYIAAPLAAAWMIRRLLHHTVTS